jgi:hypothetical protein
VRGKRGWPMTKNVLLRVMSVVAIVLMTFHLADDIVRGFESGGTFDLIAFPILAGWLYGALVLGERRSGCVIMLVGALVGLLAPVLHMTARGIGPEIGNSGGGFFFAWTMIALGASALFSVVLALRALWSMRRTRGE